MSLGVPPSRPSPHVTHTLTRTAQGLFPWSRHTAHCQLEEEMPAESDLRALLGVSLALTWPQPASDESLPLLAPPLPYPSSCFLLAPPVPAQIPRFIFWPCLMEIPFSVLNTNTYMVSPHSELVCLHFLMCEWDYKSSHQNQGKMETIWLSEKGSQGNKHCSYFEV